MPVIHVLIAFGNPGVHISIGSFWCRGGHGVAIGEFRYYDTVSAAIEGFDRAATPAALVEHVRVAAAACGYLHFLFAAGPNLGTNDFRDLVLLRHWPGQWFDEYVGEGFHACDPIAAHARGQSKAFCWIDAPIAAEDAKAVRLMKTAAQDYDMREGLCIPVHGMHGYAAAVSFAGAEVDSRPEARMAMELMAVYAMSRLMRLREEERISLAVLSRREREVLSWAAIGKTAWDTGCILSISTDTVNKHMASAMRKLKAYTKTQAVAESIRRGEIRF